LKNSIRNPWKSITKAPSAKTSGAKIRRDRLSARTASSTAASSFSRIALRSARRCLAAAWRRDSGRSALSTSAVEAHLEAADPAVADRQLEAAIPAVGQVVRDRRPVQRGDPAETAPVAEELPLAALELDLEPLARARAAQLLGERVGAEEGVHRRDAL